MIWFIMNFQQLFSIHICTHMCLYFTHFLLHIDLISFFNFELGLPPPTPSKIQTTNEFLNRPRIPSDEQYHFPGPYSFSFTFFSTQHS